MNMNISMVGVMVGLVLLLFGWQESDQKKPVKLDFEESEQGWHVQIDKEPST